ncbi:hypothetical protein [Amycolatopsis sp. NPDC049868]|uniref:hypothetical protein n=1 Tax=Amycolatopsis sp. NPDC049868 TaxID=3363934 RepID=UPI0037BAC64B
MPTDRDPIDHPTGKSPEDTSSCGRQGVTAVTDTESLQLDRMFVNFDHGGASTDQSVDYRMEGLVELVGADGRWPDLGIIAETNFWRFFGSRGQCAAEVALNTAARDRSYVVKIGSLPRERGEIGPALLYDAATVHVHEWHGDPSAPGFLERNRNLAVAAPRDLPEHKMDLFGTHDHPFDCRALDYLCGRWITDRRVGGVGFSHVGELDGVYTPTNFPAPNAARPPRSTAPCSTPKPRRCSYPAAGRSTNRPNPPRCRRAACGGETITSGSPSPSSSPPTATG